MASTAEPPSEPPTEREEPPDEMSPLISNAFASRFSQSGFPQHTSAWRGPAGSTFAQQGYGESIFGNFVKGSAWIAQLTMLAVILQFVIPIFMSKIILFSGHPLSQLIGLFAIVQSILVLQPTNLPTQKSNGQWFHAWFHLVSLGAFISGVTIIEYNKIHNGLAHFHSAHAYIGVITLAILAIQYTVGITMWAVPSLYGGEDNAKKVWKYHRWSGYLVFILLLASVASATDTDYVKSVLKAEVVPVGLACFFLFLAVLAQVSPKKLGVKREFG